MEHYQQVVVQSTITTIATTPCDICHLEGIFKISYGICSAAILPIPLDGCCYSSIYFKSLPLLTDNCKYLPGLES